MQRYTGFGLPFWPQCQHPVCASAAVTQANQLFVQGQYRAPLALAAVGVDLESGRQYVGITAQFAGHHACRVFLGHSCLKSKQEA